MRPVALKSEFIRLAADFWEVNHESLSWNHVQLFFKQSIYLCMCVVK
jgi:hypothetical protein